MVITAWVISLLAILLTPVLLIRFRKRWVAAILDPSQTSTRSCNG